MLKKIMGIVLVSTMVLPTPSIGGASGHAGHEAGSGSGGAKHCGKIGVMEIEPAPMAEIAPGSNFSFFVAGVKNSEDIEITVKKIPVPFTAVNKERFYDVTAKLPPELRATAARVNVKVKSKYAACEFDTGWLYKITG